MPNLEERKAYAQTIRTLFDGAISPDPEQINGALIEMTHQMFAEIAQCHSRFKLPAVLVKTVANIVEDSVPNEIKLIFGQISLAEYLCDRGIEKAAEKLRLSGIYPAVKAFYRAWQEYSAKDKQMRICIVTAQARWRSRFEIELLGI